MTDPSQIARMPAGSPDGGKFAANPGGSEAEASILDTAGDMAETEQPDPTEYVVVEGGLGEGSRGVDVVDLDFKDYAFEPANADEVYDAIARLEAHGLQDEADNVRAWADGKIDETALARHAATVTPSGQYAVLEGGLIQYESAGVAVIDMDFLNDTTVDRHTLENARDRLGYARQFGLEFQTRQCAEYVKVAETHLIAHTDPNPETFETLAKSEHSQVRIQVAENPAVPVDVLAPLCSDPDPWVAEAAQEHWDAI